MGASELDTSPDQGVPEDVVARARDAFRHRTGDELAVLVSDSLTEEKAPAGGHQLSFEHPQMRIDLEVAAGPGSSELRGRMDPPANAQVELQNASGEPSLSASTRDGVFRFEGVRHGLIRLRFSDMAPQPPISTDWFSV